MVIYQCEELWPDESDTRPRHWIAIVRYSEFAIIRYILDVQEGDDYPMTIEFSWDEWVELHASYGFELDGTWVGIPS